MSTRTSPRRTHAVAMRQLAHRAAVSTQALCEHKHTRWYYNRLTSYQLCQDCFAIVKQERQ